MALQGDFQRLESFDGTAITYASWGDGPALILLNGIACSDAYWTFLVPHITANGFRVVFFDYRGHGRSDMPANPNEISTPSFARDVWAVADAAGVRDAVLLGHSYGTQVMFETYRLDPDRCRGLVSVAGAFEHPLSGLSTVSLMRYLLAATEAVDPMPWATRAFWRLIGRETRALTLFGKATRMAGRDAPDEIMEEYFTKASRIDPLFLFAAAREMQQHSARDLLPEIQIPTLVLSGGNDVMTPPRVQREMVDMLPDGRLEMWEDSGHTFPVDEIDRFNERVLAFLDEIYTDDLEARRRERRAQATAVVRSDDAQKAQRVGSETTSGTPAGPASDSKG